MLVLVLAAVDALVAIYLIRYGLTRARPNGGRTVVVGGMLVVCALALAVLGWPKPAARTPRPPIPLPSTSAGQVAGV